MLKSVWCLIVFVSFCFFNHNVIASSISYKAISPVKRESSILRCMIEGSIQAVENDKENITQKKVRQKLLKEKDEKQENLLKGFSPSPLKKADKENKEPKKDSKTFQCNDSLKDPTNSPSRITLKKSDKKNITPEKPKATALKKKSSEKEIDKKRQDVGSLALSKSPLRVIPQKADVEKKKEKKQAQPLTDFLSSPSRTPLEKVSIYSPLLKKSPRAAEREYFSLFRVPLINLTKNNVQSPTVRRIYQEKDPANYWSRKCIVEREPVFQADFLFDPYAKVLTNGKWMTNLARMKEGLCPIGHRGIVDKEERTKLSHRDIEKKQKSYRIELHHLTQKDTGTDDNPIVEMHHVAHMGKNARFIIEFDSENKQVRIVHANLEKEEALKLCEPHQSIVTNVLHFRKGVSFIDRKAFNAWRAEYWKKRAEEIENGTFVGKDSLPTHVIPTRLFQ